MKRIALKLAFATVFGLLLLEGLCSALAWKRYGTLDVARINELDQGNIVLSSSGNYPEWLRPDPYFCWTRKPGRGVNRIGTKGAEFPLRRDPTKFTVLFTGGSVCDLLCQSGELEKALSGIPNLQILNGANSAWKQPHQTIVLAMYGEVADAVVSLDGFNEMWSIDGGSARLESLGPNLMDMNPILKDGYQKLAASWKCDRLRRLSRATPSRAAFFITKAMRSQIESSVETTGDGSNPFALPEGVSKADGTQFNLDQYAKYMRSMHALAVLHGLKEAHFIQPCPAIGKTLTADETQVAGTLEYGPTYQRIVNNLLPLNSDGIPVVSLLDTFDSQAESVYIDTVHCNPAGYRIMAERIATELAGLWKPERSTASTH